MVEAIVKELETLKAKVEETIAHAKSGVTTLNEDQVEKLHGMLGDIGEAAQAADQKIWHVVRDAAAATHHGGEMAVEKVEYNIFEVDAKAAGIDVAAEMVPKLTRAETVIQEVETGSESLLHKVEGIFEAVKDKAEDVLGIEHKPEEPPATA